MSFSVRIFSAYFLLIGFAIWFFTQSVTEEVLPGMRHSLEEVLVETSNLLAEMVNQDFESADFGKNNFATSVDAYKARKLSAQIWFLKKKDPSLIVYITDKNGIVRYDSRGFDLGKDYSQWNDVYLTLRGGYGARTTRYNPNDESTSVMFVAAPILKNQTIIGVLTVGKPSKTVRPFFQKIIKTIQTKSLILLALSTLIGLLIVYWLTLSIRKLTRYAEAVQAGEKVSLPYIREKELAQLASAMADMRHELEGKNYVENYLHTLTHELKSPLAAIQGAAELLNEDMEKQQQLRFINNIHSETLRLRQIVERLLKLAELEKRQTLAEISLIHTDQLINRLCADKAAIITSKQLTLNCQLLTANQVEGEAFLIQQAISNLLDNAIDFSHSRGNIEIHDFVKDDTWTLVIRDHGSGIPDFALDRIYERFYSLGRPHREQKSTGLGLSLVQEVALLHNGKIDIRNNPDHGVTAEFSIPSSQTKEK